MRKCLASLFFLLMMAPVAFSGPTQAPPVDSSQLMAWLAGGVSSNRLSRLIKDRGINFKLDRGYTKALRSAGANPAVIQVLRDSTATLAAGMQVSCPPALAKAAELAHQKRYEEAEHQLRELLRSDYKNAPLHFALADMLRQQEQWDEAFDEFTESARLMPDFPETHSRLAYLFYRSEESDNVIAEARTALSMDPRNAEAYRYLGLGLFANGLYDAALHAFEESLGQEPENPDTYYDIGITLRDKGDLHAAAVAYRHALRLNPQLGSCVSRSA